MEPERKLEFDSLVVGGGIAGLQAALDLADQGFQVAVIERGASIGGKMIRLSKVFPTLDCASCITTPKMAAAAHHDNITLFTDCDLKGLMREGDRLAAAVTQRPRYVDTVKCIGCRQCEYGCPVYVPDAEQGGFTLRKAIYIPFSNAIPQIATLDVENCSLPTLTTLEGVFVAGVAAGPKDIVDTIAEAGAAAMEASNYLHDLAGRKAA